MSDLLDRPIAFHPALARAAGSIEAGILLSQFLYWHKRSQHEGQWFWSTQADIEDQTCLSVDRQQLARKKLVKLGFLKEAHRGTPTPATIWYQVQEEIVLAACNIGEPPNSISTKHRIPIKERTESTSETTNNKNMRAREENLAKARPRKHEDLPVGMIHDLEILHRNWPLSYIEDQIDLALDHKASNKVTSRWDLYLQNWLDGARGPGNGATGLRSQNGGTETKARGSWGTSPIPGTAPYRQPPPPGAFQPTWRMEWGLGPEPEWAWGVKDGDPGYDYGKDPRMEHNPRVGRGLALGAFG